MEQRSGALVELSLHQVLEERLLGFKELVKLGESEIRLLSSTANGSYGGYAVVRNEGIDYLVYVEDNGWHCTVSGEWDEEAGIVVESKGVDILEHHIIDLNQGVILKFDEHFDAETVPGIVFAAAAYRSGQDRDQYADYIFDYLTRMQQENAPLSQPEQRDIIDHLERASALI